MRQNERQERPRSPQERELKSTMRDIPPAPLSSSTPSPEQNAKALSGMLQTAMKTFGLQLQTPMLCWRVLAD